MLGFKKISAYGLAQKKFILLKRKSNIKKFNNLLDQHKSYIADLVDKKNKIEKEISITHNSMIELEIMIDEFTDL